MVKIFIIPCIRDGLNRFGFVSVLRMRDKYISKCNFNENSIKICHIGLKILFNSTRRSGHYAPILLVPVEGWGPFGPLGALRPPVGLQYPNFEL